MMVSRSMIGRRMDRSADLPLRPRTSLKRSFIRVQISEARSGLVAISEQAPRLPPSAMTGTSAAARGHEWIRLISAHDVFCASQGPCGGAIIGASHFYFLE